MSGATEGERAARALLARYAELIDAGDFAGVGALLCEAVVTTEDGTVIASGAAEIEALYTATTRRYGEGTPRTRHLITNAVIDEDGDDRLVVRSRFTVLQAADGLGLQPIIAGRYRDVIERRGGGDGDGGADGEWVFVARCMIPELLGDLRHHLLFDFS